jgi:trk system potassium uptake protein TrkH
MSVKRLFDRLLPVQVVALGFMAVILTGSMLLYLPIASKSGESIRYIDALFTSTSCVCVTGLVAVETGMTFTIFGQAVMMGLIQIGGLGFMSIATLFFMALRKRINLRERMAIAESFNANTLSGLVRLVKSAATVTFIIEGVGAALLMIRFIPAFGVADGIFKSMFHAVSAFCNAGFDNLGNGFMNLMPYVDDPLVSGTVMALIVLGGLGFAVIYEIVSHKKGQRFSLHTKAVVGMTAALLLTGTLLFAVMEWNNPATMGGLSAGGKILAASFQAVTPRTAGFNTVDQAGLYSGSKLLSMMLMFIGASPASTGGGIKTTTFLIILVITRSVVLGRKEANIGNRRVPQDMRRRVGTITTLMAGLILIGTLLICMVEPGLALDAVLYDTVSAMCTVGLSYGITRVLTVVPKLILIALMYCGRVGPLTLSVALANRRERPEDSVRYPEGRIMIG